MTTRADFADYWMGLDTEGNDIGIRHDKLLVWASLHKPEAVDDIVKHKNWIDPDGGRMVRGNHVAEARKMGWDDLADMLDAFFESRGL